MITQEHIQEHSALRAEITQAAITIIRELAAADDTQELWCLPDTNWIEIGDDYIQFGDDWENMNTVSFDMLCDRSLVDMELEEIALHKQKKEEVARKQNTYVMVDVATWNKILTVMPELREEGKDDYTE